MAKWTNVITIKFEIELVDAMRIGGAGGGLEIGGVDPNLMALKDPISGEPYIPGSSLKGKLRCILEQEHGRFVPKRENGRIVRGREPAPRHNGEPCQCGQNECHICPILERTKTRRPNAAQLD
jgi:CRISPR-associated protein Csm3